MGGFEEIALRILAIIFVPATAILTVLLNRKHQTKTEDRDSTASAMVAVTDSAKVVVDLMTDAMAPMKERVEQQQALLEKQQDQIEAQGKHLAQVDTIVLALVGYSRDLRGQIIDLGHEPVPFPPELTQYEMSEGVSYD